MPTITTPLMNLVLPVVGPTGQPGPQWATDLNNAFTRVDQHDHSTGNGEPITPTGLNINIDMSMNNNSLIGIESLVFNNIASSSTANSLYVVAGDIWYINGVGTPIQITSGSSINVSSVGGIGGDYTTSSALVSYSNISKTYIFYQGTPNTTAPANVACGAVTITDPVVGGNGITLEVPSGFTTPYNITLPIGTPLTELPVVMNAAGQLATRVINQADTNNFLCPTGSIMAFGGSTPPTGWLYCDGSAVSRTTYAALFAVIGENFGEGDNVTTFQLPETRGLFLRGFGGIYDPDAALRTAQTTGGNTGNNVGSVQSDQYASHAHSTNAHSHGVNDPGHSHTIFTWDSGGFPPSRAQGATSGPGSAVNVNAAGTGISIQNAGVTVNNSGGNETRSKNIYVMYIIKT